MWIGPLILGALSLWFGVASGVPETWLVAPATWAVYGDPTVEVDLYLFREVNAAFILSLVTFAVGFVLYLARMHSRASRPRDRRQSAEVRPRLGPDARRAEGAGRVADADPAIGRAAALHGHHLRDAGRSGWADDLGKDALGPVMLDPAEEFDGLVFKHWAVLVFITAGALLTAYTAAG
jgi:multicomponent Na+:H+ antiporter subunit A